jgi:hypothetical protein
LNLAARLPPLVNRVRSGENLFVELRVRLLPFDNREEFVPLELI